VRDLSFNPALSFKVLIQPLDKVLQKLHFKNNKPRHIVLELKEKFNVSVLPDQYR